MKMKKLLGILLAVAMCASVLAGCGGKKEETPSETPAGTSDE